VHYIHIMTLLPASLSAFSLPVLHRLPVSRASRKHAVELGFLCSPLCVRLPLQSVTAASDDDKRALLRQLEAAALAAAAGVGGKQEAAPVWLAALEALSAAGAPLDKLLDRLAVACLGQAKGPVRVSISQAD